MSLSIQLANRFGFLILGLTNNFAYVIMLSAAYDLIKSYENHAQPVQAQTTTTLNDAFINSTTTASLPQQNASYCNQHSTSAILLADTIPSLTAKLLYPFLFVELPVAYKALATALFSAFSFLLTGLSSQQILIYTGVACASFSSGLGESTYLSNSPLYGDVALSGWAMGTGAAGLVGSMAYALLRMVLEIKWIMIIMLVVPISMLYAYFCMIHPTEMSDEPHSVSYSNSRQSADLNTSISSMNQEASQKPIEVAKHKSYGAGDQAQGHDSITSEGNLVPPSDTNEFDMQAKVRYLPTLMQYFMPLLLVYFAEYFINQGLFELIYYQEITFLDHPAQYRWFQVTYQFGVMLSRSSLDLFRIKQIWTMSILQALNALLFLAHVSKLIHIPSFYIVIALIVYEGLLGGFTYANTFYRMKKELPASRHEFAISTVTIADTLGIVMAGIVAMQAYNLLCTLYK